MGGCHQDSVGNAPQELPGEGVPPDVRASAGRARKLRSDCKFTDLQNYIEIITHMGILTYVALSLGIRRPALYRRIDRAPQLQAAREAARAVVVKVAWDQLGKAIDAKAPWALMFGMDCLLGQSASSSVPRESRSGESCTQSKTQQELVPQPEKADASTLRLIRAVERGEPWAIKYCLKHLDPDGHCGINRAHRDVENDCDFDAEGSEPQTVVAQKLPGYDQATEHAQDRFGDLIGTMKAPAAPPVMRSVPVAKSTAEAAVQTVVQPASPAPPVTKPVAASQTVVESALSAPPITKPALLAPPCKIFEASHGASPPGPMASRPVADCAPPILELMQPGVPGLSSPADRPEDVIKDSRVDQAFSGDNGSEPTPTGFG